jgi:hypothetical protein
MNTTQLMRKASALDAAKALTQVESKKVQASVKEAERLARDKSILDDACKEPSKFVSIIRSQLSRGERVLFTFDQINHRANVEADLDACEVVSEFIRQERAEGVTEETVSDSDILNLWQNGVSLGRIYSANMQAVMNWYRFNGCNKEGKAVKPYLLLGAIGYAQAVTEACGFTQAATDLQAIVHYTRVTFLSKVEEGSSDEDALGWVDEGYITARCTEIDFGEEV